MVAYYSIFGRQVGSHHLAIGVLGAMFGGSFLALSGGSKKAGVQTPPINASSPDEADFIKCVPTLLAATRLLGQYGMACICLTVSLTKGAQFHRKFLESEEKASKH
ncbi:hypothetical protein RB601_002637 [Gaeumannomyces tritici]